MNQFDRTGHIERKNKFRKTLTICFGLVRINDKYILLGDKNEKD